MASIFGDQTKTVKILGKNISIVPLTESELNGITGKSKKKIKQLSQITGFIGNIAETLQNVASLKIPTEFNNEGKPIKFRRMWSKDFIDAAKNSATMVKIMAAIFGDTPQAFEMADLKFRITPLSDAELEGIRGKSKRKMRKLSKITSYVGVICNTIGSLAALTFPTQFNEEGQATSYEKITEAQLVNASVNAMGMVKLLSSLFSDKSEKIKLGGTEIMTMPIGEAALENLKNRAKRKMKRLAKITGYIGTITNTLGSIALLNIPVGFDAEGNANKFEKITETQLVNASVNATGIVKLLASLFGDKVEKIKLGGTEVLTMPIGESALETLRNSAKRKMKRLAKISGYIGTMTTTLGSIAALKIPVEYNQEGLPIKFENITSDQLKNTSLNATGVVKLLASLFGDTAQNIKFSTGTVNVDPIPADVLDDIGVNAAWKMRLLSKISNSIGGTVKSVTEVANITTPNMTNLQTFLTDLAGVLRTVNNTDIGLNPAELLVKTKAERLGEFVQQLDIKNLMIGVRDAANFSGGATAINTVKTNLQGIVDAYVEVYKSLSDDDLGDIDNIEDFGNFVQSISNAATDIDTQSITSLATALESMAESATTMSGLSSFMENLSAGINSLKEAVDDLNSAIATYNRNPIRTGSGGGSNPTGSATQSNTQRGSESSTSGKTLNDIYNCVDAIEWLLDDIRRNTLTNSKVDY